MKRTEPAKYYQFIADQGDAEAHFDSGICPTNGRDVSLDRVEAVRQPKQAAILD
jgi:TPR repeat protein